MIKAIAFDFGGVIIPGVVLKWIKDLPKDDPKFLYFKDISHKWDLGQLSVEEFYQALATITGEDIEHLKENFYESAELYPEVVEIIKLLKKRYTIILFTNNFSYNLNRYIDKLNISYLFDEIIISSDHKLTKPNPLFYQKMLEITNLKPSEIVFIDDSQENVDAGNALGIVSFIYTDSDQLKKDLASIGVTY